MITGFANRQDRRDLGGVTRTHFERADATLQTCHAILENTCGRVRNAGVNVTRFLQSKETRGAIRAGQILGGGLIDGDGTTTGDRIRLIARVQLPCGETKLARRLHKNSCHLLPRIGNVDFCWRLP